MEKKKRHCQQRNSKYKEEPNGNSRTEKYKSPQINSVDSLNRTINVFDDRTIEITQPK